MKGSLRIAIIGALFLLSSTYPCLASTLYVESLVKGEAESPFGLDEANGFIGGFDAHFDAFWIGLEYLDGKLETSSPDMPADKPEQNIAIFKAGYRILETNRTAFDLTVNYYWQQLNGEVGNGINLDTITFDGILAGADFNLFFTDRLALELTAAVSLNANYKTGTSDVKTHFDADIFNYKLKLNYLFSNHFGASLGYRAYLSKNASDEEFNTTSLSTGIFYKF